MGFLDWFKVQPKQLAEEKKIVVVDHRDALGSSGTEVYGGYMSEDYLQEMRGKQRADLFDKMYRSDYQTKACITAVKNPIMKAKWSVEPYNMDDEESEKDARLVEWCLFEGMQKTFSDFMNEALSVLKHGHAVFEVIDSVNLSHPEFGPVNGIKTLAFRSQRTIERWNFDRKTEELLSISQYAYGDTGEVVDIPAKFLLVFTLDKEGINYEGISPLRSVYGSYFRKNLIMKLNTIGIEKFAVPTPIGKVPAGMEGRSEFTQFKNALQAWTSHEKAFITVPEGFDVTLHSNAYDPQKVETSIDNEDKRTVKAFLANFLELGINGFGSQSLSVDLSDFFLASIEHVAKGVIAQEINRRIIPRIIQMNRGPRPGYPKLCVRGISDKAGKELAEVMSLLIPNKVITPDDKLEDHMRDMYDLPEMSEEGQRSVQKAEAVNPFLMEKYRKLRRG